jgi:putative flavoprotein involved in K+ transport
MERTDVAVIGAGQTGLAMSVCLGRAGIDHVVIERGRVGERWLGERRPGLRLLTPAWMTRLPGFTLPSVHPESFLPIQSFAALLGNHAKARSVPLRPGTAVEAVQQWGDRFLLTTSRGLVLVRAIVVATGACDRPAMPGWARDLPSSVEQFTADRFHASALPPGGVLVVGASASGAQIAAELAATGRAVTLATGRHVRAPRRYRGRDLFAWLDASGFLREPRPVGIGAPKSAPSLPLAGGPVPGQGEAIGLDRLHCLGVRITGRALGMTGSAVHTALTLQSEIQAAEQRRRKLLGLIDEYIAHTGDPTPSEPDAWSLPPMIPDAPTKIDLRAMGIRSVVWATGYRRTYPWLRLPVLGPDGEIRQAGGITPLPGVFTLGLPFMRHRSSALIDGVGCDAEALVPQIQRHLGHVRPLAA